MEHLGRFEATVEQLFQAVLQEMRLQRESVTEERLDRILQQVPDDISKEGIIEERLDRVLQQVPDDISKESVTEERLDRILQQVPDDISKEVAREVLNICQEQANKSVRENSEAYAAVSFVTGDKTQQHVDAIATTTDARPDDGSAGDGESSIFVTDGGDLSCQSVYNVLIHALPLTEQRLRGLTDGVLRKAEHDGISSIAFQATGYGMDSLPKAVLAKAILDTALNYVCDSLDEIVVCADKSEVDTIKAFTAEIDKRPQLGKGKELGSTFTVTIVKGDIVHQDVDVIVNSTSSSLNLASGQLSSAIYNAAGDSIQEECRVKYPTGVTTEEIAETSGGRLPSGRIYHTSLGIWSEENYRAFFIKCLTKASSSRLKSIAFPLIGTGILAYPCDEVAECIFKSFDQFKTSNPDTSLCEARIVVYPEDKANLEIFEGATPTEAAADVRPVNSTTSEFTLQTAVGMAGLIQLPAHWSPMTEEQFVSEVQLKPEDKEYKLVARQFNTGVDNEYTIVEIKRIQNRTLYLQYVMFLHQMETQNPGMDVERHLWHGTTGDVVTSINIHGFIRSYVTVHLYGKGSYFAVNTSYSARDLYSPPNEDGTKHVYYASVLTGHFTKGKVDMVAPPSRGLKDPNVLYDSLVDNVDNPSMFVVFNDVQAYPKYLITFRE
ncbi:protein mono-ADP-ribosyltransferase PARP15-like isoform X3 [Haliotis rufescens]|uniref:protein mono-ADP-ribosyltransferase PARP15-like isoform X3 n=1 Tax=Haliotis rufescens TaxID=6454 RepID=UPI00201EF139|nr:protein mono-ADP-ribosyltransferase PARP15-like isoform X3 [Haliotis rufescens]